MSFSQVGFKHFVKVLNMQVLCYAAQSILLCTVRLTDNHACPMAAASTLAFYRAAYRQVFCNSVCLSDMTLYKSGEHPWDKNTNDFAFFSLQTSLSAKV